MPRFGAFSGVSRRSRRLETKAWAFRGLSWMSPAKRVDDERDDRERESQGIDREREVQERGREGER